MFSSTFGHSSFSLLAPVAWQSFSLRPLWHGPWFGLRSNAISQFSLAELSLCGLFMSTCSLFLASLCLLACAFENFEMFQIRPSARFGGARFVAGDIFTARFIRSLWKGLLWKAGFARCGTHFARFYRSHKDLKGSFWRDSLWRG